MPPRPNGNPLQPLGRTVALAGATMLALILAAAPTHADPGGPSSEPDLSGVESVVEEVLPAQLAEDKIPGAVVTVVADGSTVFSEAYGVADTATGTAMQADTGFYTASEAKLFTATAALQLVRQGKLDLHADVNQYLDFTIDDAYPGQPVTLHHLLTYTSGFDNNIYGWSQWTYDEMPSLAEFAPQVQPARVRPPGELVAYNNYDYVLMGRLIEIASGQPYADYLAEHVFEPLGMDRTSAQQPQPQELQAQVATGHRPAGESQVETVGQVSPATPAGSDMITTGGDMARFMIAQLQQDPALGRGIAAQMQQRHFTADDRMPGMGYAFEERPRNGQPVWLKDGDLPGTHHNLALLPDSDVGIHVAYNGDGVNQSAYWDGKELVNKIIDGAVAPPEQPGRTEPVETDVSDYAGSYADSRTSQTSFMKVSGLTAPITVEADGPGRLITSGLSEDDGVSEQRWVQTEPGLFRLEGGAATIAFDGDGSLVTSQIPVAGYQQLPWHQAPMLHLVLLGTSALVLLGAFVLIPIRALVLRVRARNTTPPQARFAVVLGWLASLCVVMFGAGFAYLSSDPNRLMQIPFTGDPILSIALNTISVLAVITIAVVVAAVLAWARRWWTLLGRLAYSVVAVAAIAFVAMAVLYRLIGVPLVVTV